MRRLIGLLAALAAVVASPAWCESPPFDTPDTAVAAGFEVGVIVDVAGDEEGVVGAQTLDLTIPLASRIEATLAPSWVVVERGGRTRSGPGDTEAALKVLLLREGRRLPAVAIVPTLVLPTAARGLGERGVQARLPLIASKALGPYRLTAQVAYAQAGADDYAPLALLIERTVGPHWTVGAEAVSQEPLRRRCRRRAEFNVGASYELHEGLALQLLVGRSLGAGADAHGRLALVASI